MFIWFSQQQSQGFPLSDPSFVQKDEFNLELKGPTPVCDDRSFLNGRKTKGKKKRIKW